VDISLWTNFAIQLAVIAYLTAGIFGALAGYALASVGAYRPWIGIALGGLVPVLGVLGLAIASIARAQGRSSRSSTEGWWVTSRAGRHTLLAVVALAGLLAACLPLAWFNFRLPGVPGSALGVWGSPIGVMIAVSILVVVLAALLGLRRPSRLAGTAAAAVGSVWLFVSGATIALRAPVLQLAASIEAVKISPDNIRAFFASTFGLNISNVPTFSSEVLATSDLPLRLGQDNSLSLASILLEPGPAWYCLLAFAAGSIAWAWIVLRIANRAPIRRVALPVPDKPVIASTLPTGTPEDSIWRQSDAES
jgi:hypothetical protein